MSIALSIIVPAHNEGARLVDGFARLMPIIEEIGRDRVEVIVVDDGSSDDTGRRAAELLHGLQHTLVIRCETNGGKGAALKIGIGVAQGAIAVTCDADMSIHPRQIPQLLTALENADVAVGSRARGGRIRYDSVLRTSAGGVFNSLVRRWTGISVRDTQCGFKGFHLGVARLFAIFGHINGFAFDAEWLYLANRIGVTTAVVDVEWDDVAGSSVSVGRDSWRMLMDIREVPTSTFRTVAVRVAAGVDRNIVAKACRDARVQGAVIARGSDMDIIVLRRDGAPGGLGIGKVCDGQLGVVGIDELRDRRLEAV
mgnify:FL=1